MDLIPLLYSVKNSKHHVQKLFQNIDSKYADIAHKAPNGILELTLGVVIIFIIGFFTIGSQTYNAAKANPANTLRNE